MTRKIDRSRRQAGTPCVIARQAGAGIPRGNLTAWTLTGRLLAQKSARPGRQRQDRARGGERVSAGHSTRSPTAAISGKGEASGQGVAGSNPVSPTFWGLICSCRSGPYFVPTVPPSNDGQVGPLGTRGGPPGRQRGSGVQHRLHVRVQIAAGDGRVLVAGDSLELGADVVEAPAPVGQQDGHSRGRRLVRRNALIW